MSALVNSRLYNHTLTAFERDGVSLNDSKSDEILAPQFGHCYFSYSRKTNDFYLAVEYRGTCEPIVGNAVDSEMVWVPNISGH